MENLDKVVYEKIARKDLSFGCIIFKKPYGYMKYCWGEGFSGGLDCIMTEWNWYCVWFEDSFTKEIIGHPILLSDVLSFINIWIRDSDDFDKAAELIKKYESLVWIWNPSKPYYEEQLEVCKDFIRNLCKDA